ncbi:MAG: hypothetical protein CVV01_02955, partial [Firmicutes bacterium HGW-Firmicutes-6]
MLDTKINQQLIEILQTDLLKWFEKAQRNLPFRQTKNPYFIWISEIMAQQTQIDTLIPFYNRFIANFPTVFSLALASEDEVIKAWEGLGYYSRARNLHKAARIIVADYDGLMPDNFAELIKLPGIGPYTGGAIASIAFNEPASSLMSRTRVKTLTQDTIIFGAIGFILGFIAISTSLFVALRSYHEARA